MIAVCNFTPLPRSGYRLGAPRIGRWREILNSDAGAYGGSGIGNLGAVFATAAGLPRPAVLAHAEPAAAGDHPAAPRRRPLRRGHAPWGTCAPVGAASAAIGMGSRPKPLPKNLRAADSWPVTWPAAGLAARTGRTARCAVGWARRQLRRVLPKTRRLWISACSTPPAASEVARLAMPECTDDVWHGYLPNARPGQLYGYRVHGPYEPKCGHRFNRHKLLLDPYARQLVGALRWHDSLYGYRVGSPRADLSFDRRDSAAHMPKAAIVRRPLRLGRRRARRTCPGPTRSSTKCTCAASP